MVSNHTDASLAAQPPSGDEMDLYDELMSFSVLTPEQRESEITSTAPKPEAELYSDPEVADPPRAASPSPGITHAATITVYKSPVRCEAGDNPDQSFIVLDAEELLSEDEVPDDLNGKPFETLSTTGPLDVQISSVSTDGRTTVTCRACGCESDGEDLFCPDCGSMLNESASD